MPIPPIPPVSLEPLHPVALGDGLLDGRILEARLTALLSNTLARLDIEGRPLVVTLSKPLPVGVALTLKVEREDGQVKLIVQGPVRDMPEAPIRAAAPQRIVGTLTEPVKTALAKIQTLTVEAMLDQSPAAEPLLAQSPASAAYAQAEAAPEPHIASGTPRAPRENDAAPFAAVLSAGEDAPEAGEHGAVRVETPEFRQIAVSSEAVSGHGRTEQTAVFTVGIPVFLPGFAAPLRLHVTQHEEAAREDEEDPRSPYWTVRFAAEAGRLGMVHAAISLIDGPYRRAALGRAGGNGGSTQTKRTAIAGCAARIRSQAGRGQHRAGRASR